MSSGGGHGGRGELKLPFLHMLEELVESSNEKSGIFFHAWALMGPAALIIILFFIFAPEQSVRNFELLFFLSPVWLPLLLARFATVAFVLMRRVAYNAADKRKTLLLEVRLPRDTMKSPAAMEAAFANISFGPGEGTWYKKYYLGRTRPWFSFEIASIGGEVHFYIWLREQFRRSVESFIYAQYPGVEIIETEDYSRLVNPAQPPFKMFSCEYTKTKPDPYPVKTYVDYGLDVPSLKAEQAVDPLAQVLELMSSIGPYEQLWLQIIVRSAKGEKYRWREGKKPGQKYTWKDEAKEIVDGIRKEIVKVNPETGAESFPNPSKDQTERMAAISRNVGKLACDTGIRAIYFAPPDKFVSTMAPSTANIFRPFNTEVYNAVLPNPNIGSEKFNDYPWEDIGGKRQARELRELAEMYRRRAYFHPPYRGPWMTMSIEELATIWHIPSRSVSAPSLPRIQSATSGAPSNLPV